MAFPTSPTNGQQANINGITYTYSNTLPAWTVSTSVSNTFVSISVSANVNSGNILNTGLISTTGNITGSYILGNGSQLTGVSTGSAGNISNGTSNVNVVSSGGNVSVGVGGTGNVAVFATTGEYVTGVVSASGNITGSNISTTGVLQAPAAVSTNGITVNANTVAADYTIAAGNNGMSAGPMTVANGITVTVSSGSTWTVV
jgi:hypothetical protein